jgi:DNA polymerase I-like protein with 3'-5' exonuclease and polymerase domains
VSRIVKALLSLPDPVLTPVNISTLNPPLNVTRVVDGAGLDQLDAFFRTLAETSVSPETGWDIETTPLKDYFYRRCRTIQFGNQNEQYVIDLLAFADGNSDTLYSSQGHYGRNQKSRGIQAVLDIITPVLCGDRYTKVGVSLSFEYMSFYWMFGLRTRKFWDCALVEKCIWAGAHSMKDYGFYSMEEMMARYFHLQIDKMYQESFTLDAELSDHQIGYAALDTRYPFGIKSCQGLILQGHTTATLQKQNNLAWKAIARIDPIVTGDNLVEIARIENDAIGAFQDMHIHGERLDRVRWLARVARSKQRLADLVADVLDPIFIPLVGDKRESATDDEINRAEAYWKSFNTVPDRELKMKSEIHLAKKIKDPMLQPLIDILAEMVTQRKAEKEIHKTTCSDLKKKRTRIKNLATDSQGNALINYNSDTQLLAVLGGMRGLKGIKSLDDSFTETLEHIPVISAIRKLHTYNKDIGTYGDQWAMGWVTKPCKEEGWLHPGDGRLHCTYNQYDAATGRSSSEKPNGQNLPQDPEVRECFIADPPNPDILLSACCEELLNDDDIDRETSRYFCPKCHNACDTHAEEYVIVTADMSGAELRIIAELADDPVWIGAFARKEDVHSVGTEILYEEVWPTLTQPECAYFKLTENGEPQRKKCKCPGHENLRSDNKSTNFLLAYGGGPDALAAAIKKAVQVARDLMALHEKKFPRIWAYLSESGRNAKMLMKSFDMFGRRRLFPKPNRDRARIKARERSEEKLRLPDEVAESNKANFLRDNNGIKPNKEQLWTLTHNEPTDKQVMSALMGMHGSIERQGKNHAIQGTNATIAKLAMGSGYSPDGQPYLWHTLPLYRAKLLKFVHDELVVHCPKQHGERVGALIGNAFKRAAAEKMKKVVMEFEYNIASYWKK